MYGFIAHFDYKTEEYIKELWKELSELGISKYAEEVSDRRPHLTLASYNDLDVEQFIEEVDSYYNEFHPLEVSFSTLGTFMNSGTLFLTPTITFPLLRFHQQHHERFASYNDNPNSLYLPGKWIPHCTIANRLNQEKMTEAFQYCTTKMESIHSKIAEVSLIKVVYEAGKSVAAPTVFTKTLG